MSYLKVTDLSVGYEGHVVTGHIDFEVNKGDYLCIIGENGAGKSTLMKTLLHLNKPVLGQIQYGDGMQAQEIGYLPQQTIVQRDFPASVWEIVMSGLLSRCGHKLFWGKAEKEIAQRYLQEMQIWDLRKKCYRNLSGGQQQRVLLARALCATDKLLLLDEPVSGLDPKVSQNFYQTLDRLHEEGITIMMITHDIQIAVTKASHILHIGKNEHFYGTVAEYQNSRIGKELLYHDGIYNEIV